MQSNITVVRAARLTWELLHSRALTLLLKQPYITAVRGPDFYLSLHSMHHVHQEMSCAWRIGTERTSTVNANSKYSKTPWAKFDAAVLTSSVFRIGTQSILFYFVFVLWWWRTQGLEVSGGVSSIYSLASEGGKLWVVWRSVSMHRLGHTATGHYTNPVSCVQKAHWIIYTNKYLV